MQKNQGHFNVWYPIIARNMVMRYGMDERLGHLSFEEVRAPLLPTPFERAQGILKRHRNVLEEGARELLRKVTLSEPDVAAIAQRLAPLAQQQPEGMRDELFVPGA
jgi:ATP-dependent Zn protease